MWRCDNLPYFSWLGGIFPGGIFSILLWGLIILVFVLLFRKLFGSLKSRRTGQNRDRGDSFEILKERYARGELSRDEYTRMKYALLQPR